MREYINLVETAQHEDRVVVYHGTNQRNLTELSAGSWVTEDPETAMAFAQEKVDSLGGQPCIYSLTVGENDVDWDHLSAMAGVDDLRGQLQHAMGAQLAHLTEDVQEVPADRGVTFTTDEGHITVASYEYSPRKYSVVSFNVQEEARNKGIGRMLLKHAVERFPDIGAQVDGAASLKLFYELGFRNPSNPQGSLADYEQVRQTDSSIFMALKDRNGVPYTRLTEA